jgi:hypothetical protein
VKFMLARNKTPRAKESVTALEPIPGICELAVATALCAVVTFGVLDAAHGRGYISNNDLLRRAFAELPAAIWGPVW